MICMTDLSQILNIKITEEMNKVIRNNLYLEHLFLLHMS